MGTNVRQNIVTNGLVLYLDVGNRMSYTSGSTTWSDLSGNGRNATLVNSPAFNNTNQGFITFNGTNQFGTGSAITGLGTSDRTINIWTKVDTLKSTAARIFFLATDEASTDTPAFGLTFYTTTPTAQVEAGGAPYDGAIILSMVTGSWFNICTTITSTKIITAYQNSLLVSSKTFTGTCGTNPIPEIARYNNNFGQYGNPNIGVIQIYNRVLSAQEVAQNYNATKTRFGLT